MFRCCFLLGLGLALLTCGCVEQSAAGFRLPEGDSARGRAAFVKFQCSACHTMEAVDLKAPVADPPVGVELGLKLRKRSTGELVTSIINPSHKISNSWTGGVTRVGNESRMSNYADIMTVQELADVVAFIKTHQEVEAPSSLF